MLSNNISHKVKESALSNPQSSGSSIECHHFHGWGHITLCCPLYTITLEHELEDAWESEASEQVYEPLNSAFDLRL